MAGIKTQSIKNISDYIKYIERFKKSHNKVWFRGHSENNYELKPSIYRLPFKPENEGELTSQFKSKAIPYLNNLPSGNENQKYFEWLFLMQHYGMPTRLLDWTESPLIALAFAIMFRDNEKKRTDEGVHIWCISPTELNKNYNSYRDGIIPNIIDNNDALSTCYKSSTSLEQPLAIYGPQNNPRIVGQKGVFTIFSDRNTNTLEKYLTEKNSLKLTIDTNNDIKIILNQLYNLGISESMIFPQLENVSLEIKNTFIREKK